jgi:hypothetical protein
VRNSRQGNCRRGAALHRGDRTPILRNASAKVLGVRRAHVEPTPCPRGGDKVVAGHKPIRHIGRRASSLKQRRILHSEPSMGRRNHPAPDSKLGARYCRGNRGGRGCSGNGCCDDGQGDRRAVSGGISGAASGKDAAGIVRGAGIGAVVGAVNPAGALGATGVLQAGLNSSASNLAGQLLNSAVTGSAISVSGVVAAGAGRIGFGYPTGGISPSGLLETVGFQTMAGSLSGTMSRLVSAAHLP